MSHAMYGHPRQTGHGGEFWQNVIYWKREWQTTSAFSPREPYEQCEKEKTKDMTLKDEVTRSKSTQYATGEE